MKAIEVRDREALEEMSKVIQDEPQSKARDIRIVWRTDDWFDAYSVGRLYRRVKVRGAVVTDDE